MKSLSVSERHGWARYAGQQVYYSLVGRDYEWELMPLALDQGLGAQLVPTPLCVLADVHQARVPQDPEVLGHARLAHLE